MKVLPILFLLAMICGCGTPEPTPDPVATTPTPSAKTDTAKTPPAETASPDEAAQREFDAEVLVFKKWVESEYGKATAGLYPPRLPGEPVGLAGEGSAPTEKLIPFVKVLKRNIDPPPEGIERLRKMCAEGTARYKKLSEHPYGQKHPWELPKKPEFDVDFLVKLHQERASNQYQYHLKKLREQDRDAAQDIESGITPTAEELAARAEKRAARAAHDADKKQLEILGRELGRCVADLTPEYEWNSVREPELRRWIQYGTALRKRYAETKLFNKGSIESLHKVCREMKPLVERLKTSTVRFEDYVKLPELASYDSDALLAKQAKESDKILVQHEGIMAPYSPLAVRLLKEGKSTPDEIVAAVSEERKASLEIILEKRKKILAELDALREKFEAATTLEEMKTVAAEASQIHKEPLHANYNEFYRWRGSCTHIGIKEERHLSDFLSERNPVSRMYNLIDKIETKKLDISDPAVRAKLLPLFAK